MSLLISISDATARVGLPVDDAAYFAAVVAAADGAVKAFLHIDPMQQSWTEAYNGTGASVLVLNHTPITAVSALSLQPQAIWGMPFPPIAFDLSKITFDRNAIYWSSSIFPLGQKNILVTYTAGYAAGSPEMSLIAQATLLVIKAMWSGKDADQNVSSQSFGGVINYNFWQTGPGGIPPQAQMLLQPYVNRFLVA